jgi:hypothetical protein
MRSRPPIWPSGQSYWLQIQGTGFDSRRYQAFWVWDGVHSASLSTTDDILGRTISDFGLESQDYGRRRQRDTPLSAKVGTNFVDKRRTKATEFSFQYMGSPSRRVDPKVGLDAEGKREMASLSIP